MKHLIYWAFILLTIIGCSPVRRISRDLRTQATSTDHFTGVALYDPATGRRLIQHNADKPFIPASNAKLFSFYAGLLTLPDSLPALLYVVRNDSLIFWGTGNPLLLHPVLSDTTALAFLRSRPERLFFSAANYTGPRFGSAWAWNDYNGDYAAELAPLPLYGNVVRFTGEQVSPGRFRDSIQTTADVLTTVGVRRNEFSNAFVRPADVKNLRQDVPFRWSAQLTAQLLSDTLHRPVGVVRQPLPSAARLLRGSPTDSLYKRMLHVSDNQFAEQVLFMVSAERSRVATGLSRLEPVAEIRRMNDEVLRYPANAVRWVDGSGLSRHNLVTPNTLIDVLAKIWARVPPNRLFALLPAAGQSGTVRTVLPATNTPYVWAKSGSLSGVYTLSGYLQTRRKKLLFFSIMHNNFTQPIAEMRRRTGELLQRLHEQF